MRILLADDDSKMHIIVGLWLTRHGHTLESAYNGRESLHKIGENRFDVLIADVNMPLMNGIELVKAVQTLPCAPQRIIIMTSRCDAQDIKAQLPGKNITVFSKPFSPQDLLALVEKNPILEAASP